MESTEPETKKRKVTKKGCLGCLGIGAGLFVLFAFLGSLLPDPDPPEQEAEHADVAPPELPQPTSEQLDEAARVNVGRMAMELGEIYKKQGEFAELASPQLQSDCNWRSLNEESCRIILGSSLSMAQGVIYVNEIARTRIRRYQADGRDLGEGVSSALNTMKESDQNSRTTIDAVLKLARQVELESEVRTLGNSYRDAPMFKSFVQRWNR